MGGYRRLIIKISPTIEKPKYILKTTNQAKLLIVSKTVWILIFTINILSWFKCQIVNSDYCIFIPFVLTFLVFFPTLIIGAQSRRYIEYEKINPSEEDGLRLKPFYSDSPRAYQIGLILAFLNLVFALVTNYDKMNTGVYISADKYILTDELDKNWIVSKEVYNNYSLEGVKIVTSAVLFFQMIALIILDRLVSWGKNDK